MKKILIFAVCLLLALGVLNILPIHGEEEIYDSVLRLHVLANSDSEEDQTLKLKVRDAIVEYSAERFGTFENVDEAMEAVENELDSIRDIALAVVRSEGYDYDVSVWIGEEEYPTRSYESFCFPAGEYKSLRVCIGDAEGKNWWCVLFPPLCLSSVSEKSAEEEFISVGLTPDQYKIITESEAPKYKIRFKLLEIISDIFG